MLFGRNSLGAESRPTTLCCSMAGSCRLHDIRQPHGWTASACKSNVGRMPLWSFHTASWGLLTCLLGGKSLPGLPLQNQPAMATAATKLMQHRWMSWGCPGSERAGCGRPAIPAPLAPRMDEKMATGDQSFRALLQRPLRCQSSGRGRDSCHPPL